jgi:hypothetical protein
MYTHATHARSTCCVGKSNMICDNNNYCENRDQPSALDCVHEPKAHGLIKRQCFAWCLWPVLHNFVVLRSQSCLTRSPDLAIFVLMTDTKPIPSLLAHVHVLTVVDVLQTVITTLTIIQVRIIIALRICSYFIHNQVQWSNRVHAWHFERWKRGVSEW